MQSGLPTSDQYVNAPAFAADGTTPSGAEPASSFPLAPKDWWRSRTILGALAVILAQGLRAAGVEIGDADLTDLIVELATVAGALVSIVGRMRATRPLTTAAPGTALQIWMIICGLPATLMLGACSSPAWGVQGSVSVGYHGNSLRLGSDGKTTTVDLDLPDLGGLDK